MSIKWKGVFPAMTTKFTQKDKLDLPLFAKNMEAQIDAGIDGIILGGTLGEASVLTTDEKETLVKFAVENQMINSCCTKYSRRLYKRSDKAG